MSGRGLDNCTVGAPKGTSSCFIEILKRKESLLRAMGVSFRASITVEASMALPLFIFFFVNIMTLFNIVKVQSDIEAALHQTGSEISMRAFDVKAAGDVISGDEGDYGGGIATGILSSIYASESVRSYLGSGIDKSCVTGGASGISFLASRVMLGNDIVDIVADYKVHPIISLIGFREFPVEARFYGHAWTGYDIFGGIEGGTNEEEMVYVTEHGEVFHRNIDCKHLRLDVQSVPFGSVGDLRNEDGSKYYACEYCGAGLGGGDVFITKYGNRYHSSVNCPGLKRKIYTIPISEVGGRPPCSNCG
ncbi:MAG: hypothetical protein K6G10_12930 [Butyrivibrio sp.]|nr:hypothetical protein [Butyrivibrio sp.]